MVVGDAPVPTSPTRRRATPSAGATSMRWWCRRPGARPARPTSSRPRRTTRRSTPRQRRLAHAAVGDDQGERRRVTGPTLLYTKNPPTTTILTIPPTWGSARPSTTWKKTSISIWPGRAWRSHRGRAGRWARRKQGERSRWRGRRSARSDDWASTCTATRARRAGEQAQRRLIPAQGSGSPAGYRYSYLDTRGWSRARPTGTGWRTSA